MKGDLIMNSEKARKSPADFGISPQTAKAMVQFFKKTSAPRLAAVKAREEEKLNK